MSSEKTQPSGTEELPARKISLMKLSGRGRERKKGGVIAWECAPPKVGQPYAVYLYEGMVLRTSPVQSIQETEKAFIVETLNSVYQLEYLGEGPID